MPKGIIMRPEEYPTSRLVKWFEKERILTWDRITQALGNPSRITIFRKLAQLGARASYSHRGRYQTLDRIAQYDANGLWSFQGVHFSRHGTLVQTLVSLVEQSPQGYLASELKSVVQVRVHNALAHLYATKRLDREPLAQEYLYLSPTGGQEQRERRSQAIPQAPSRKSPGLEEERSEWEASLRFLVSVLNERDRRLYLGLESIRLGHGGDAQIARLADVNVKTVALGRRQLLAHDVTADRIREAGAGRPPLKKN